MPESSDWPYNPDAPHPEPSPSLLVEEGLTLRFPMESDASELFLKVDSNRAYLREWLPWLDDVSSVEDEVMAIRRGAASGNGCMYLISLDGAIVGTLGINSIDWENRRFVIGYWLAEDCTGQGIISKCCLRLLEHCFEELHLHSVTILVAAENFNSRAVAERLGMRLEGIAKDREWLYDHFVDAAIYGLTQPEWSAINQD
jgi:ribosomal-protein-serine acetyltransferase